MYVYIVSTLVYAIMQWIEQQSMTIYNVSNMTLIGHTIPEAEWDQN